MKRDDFTGQVDKRSIFSIRAAAQVLSFDVLSKGLLGAVGIALIHFMPQGEYARYTLGLSIIAVVTQTLALSFNRIYIVGYEKLRIEEFPSSFLVFQLLTLVSVTVLAFPFRALADGTYWFIVGAIFATCLSEFSKTVFQRELKFFRYSIVEITRTVVFVSGVLLLIFVLRYDLEAWQVFVVQTAALLAAFLVFSRSLLHLTELLKVRESLRLGLSVVRGSYRYLFGYFFLLAFFLQVSVFVLKAVAGNEALASYGSAFRYASLLSLALAAVQAVLLPVVQRARSTGELEDVFRKHRKMILFFIPPVLLAMWISGWIIPWVDAGKYPDAVAIFRILAISAMISFVFSPHVNLVMRFEDFRFLFLLICAALALSVGLNVVLTGWMGPIGAATATLISVATVSGSQFLRGRTYKNRLPES